MAKGHERSITTTSLAKETDAVMRRRLREEANPQHCEDACRRRRQIPWTRFYL